MAPDVTKLVVGLNAHQIHAFKRLAVPVLMALRESIQNGWETVTVDIDQAQTKTVPCVWEKRKKVKDASHTK